MCRCDQRSKSKDKEAFPFFEYSACIGAPVGSLTWRGGGREEEAKRGESEFFFIKKIIETLLNQYIALKILKKRPKTQNKSEIKNIFKLKYVFRHFQCKTISKWNSLYYMKSFDKKINDFGCQNWC